MANYANKHFEEYVPEDSLKQAILCQNPVQDDLDNVKKLDDFSRNILKEKHKANKQNKKKTNFVAPFHGWGSTTSRLEPRLGGSLLFTT